MALMTATHQHSTSSRIAEPDEGIGAGRARPRRPQPRACRWRRCATTSPRSGCTTCLIHYDIPDVDPAAWRLTVDGRVGPPLTLTLDDAAGPAPGDDAGHAGVCGQRAGPAAARAR